MSNMKLEEIQERHSVRSFREIPLKRSDVDTLKAELTMINTHESGLIFRLFTDNTDPFGHFNKSYGFFRNARNYIAVIIDRNYTDVIERAGYCAEQVVLKATSMGIGSCFVGGTYDRNSIDTPIRAGQEILFIIVIGYPDTIEAERPLARLAMKIAHRKKMDYESFYVEREGWPVEKALKEFKWLKDGLMAVACAPSSLNKRPVRIWVGQTTENKPIVRIGIPEIKERQYIDLGIAKCNFSEVVEGYFDWGNGACFHHD
ncbi:MAG: nitroreductase family protein [Muribaculum sp.]|nr:nitroreductase family protein [Muribaculum sp.]